VSDRDDYDTHRIIGLDIGTDSKSDTVEPALCVVHLHLDLEADTTALQFFESDEPPEAAATLTLNTFNGMMSVLYDGGETAYTGDVSDLVAALESLKHE